jgi:DNA ligase D-like protein (predicted 3'-phosphoesterase)
VARLGVTAFVVQKHAASTLHYDFRLEVAGVLRSWAVPKGPSLDPAHKRLAMPVPDHPLSWGSFEGRIHRGYGKGAVIVWDHGEYGADDIEAGLADGHATFDLDGHKLHGGFLLQRTGERWLLIKRDDGHARRGSDIAAERPESVVSGRTIEDLT